MKHFSWVIGAAFLSVALVIGSLSYSDTPNNNQAHQAWDPEHLQLSNLPNAYRLNAKVISGGEPNGEAGFQELSKLKIKTVVSVDGVRPQLELAKKYGIQYVHLPLGYGRISDQRVTELVKVVRGLSGPIYFHCHHGLHRSPTAAAVASVGAGIMKPSNATAVLDLVGTGKQYQELYDSAANAKRVDDSVLDAMPDSFPKVAIVEPFAIRMAQLERTYDRLVRTQQSNWKPSQVQPEMQPAYEALLLREHFAELLRMEETHVQPEEFGMLMEQCHTAAEHLELQLRSLKGQGQFSFDAIESSFKLIASSCVKCHEKYRE